MIVELLKRNKLTFFIGKLIFIVYHNYTIDSLRYVRYILVKNGWLKNKRFNNLKKFKNIHEGKRCFIVATGPSLEYKDLNLIKNEYSFSVNSIVKILDKTDWRPNYFGIQDGYVYEKIEKEIVESNLSPIFVGHRLQDKFKSAKNYYSYFHFSCFHGKHGEMVPLTSDFSNEISEIVYDGYSVTYSMLQIAVYMGFKEIYLLGTDCSYDIKGKQHFVESGFFDKQALTVGQRMIYAFKKAKQAADSNDFKIFNATRGGMLEVFERVDLDSLF